MTKKSDKGTPNGGWENRLAFLGGIADADESESFLTEDEREEDNALVPALGPKPFPRRRPRQKTAAARQKSRIAAARREAEQTKKSPPPKKDTPSEKARKEVRQRVDELRDEVLRKGMPGIALSLYRDGREKINELNNYSDEFEVQRAGWYLQAAVQAFEIAERYSDAAEVLMFLVRWSLKTNSVNDVGVRGLLNKARTYLDRRTDNKLIADCDELELLAASFRAKSD